MAAVAAVPQDLERVQHRRGPHLEKRVAQPVLAHVERHFGIKDAHVEREQSIHVLGQERDVVDAVDELHGSDLPPLLSLESTWQTNADQNF